MDGLGMRLKARARELGLSDSEVARRLGIAQTRYANYVADRHEPNLDTLLEICAVLNLEPAEVLGYEPPTSGSAASRMRKRIQTSCLGMDDATLRVVVRVTDALATVPPSRATLRKNKTGRNAAS